MLIKQIPNLLTGLRLLFVPLVVLLMLESEFIAALGVFAMMGISDALDGFLAKRYGWQTPLGEFLDPLADKTMLVSAYVTLGYLALIPLWLVILIILRDVVILAGATAYHLLTHRLRMAPSLISKFNTLTQIVLVLAVVFNQIFTLPAALLYTLTGLTLLTTVASGLSYVIEWSLRAKRDVQQETE